MFTLQQTQGCLLGLALGDASGAPFEGGLLERFLWRLIGRTRRGEMRWTDDTQMSIDVVETFLLTGKLDPDELAKRFAQSYRWSRGYGPGAAKILRRIAAGADWREANRAVYPAGSFGNGAAMRAPLIGVIYAHDPTALAAATRASAMVTHAHPLAIEGALLIAQSTAEVIAGRETRDIFAASKSHISQVEYTSRLAVAQQWIETGQTVSTKNVIQQLGNGIAAHESCVTALYLALRFRDQPFTALLEFIAACGGDADTIGAMAGAIWGVANGVSKLPPHLLEKLEQRERLTELAAALQQQLLERAATQSS